MTTKLKRIDGDLALILEPRTLEALGIDEGTSLEVFADETGIHIRRTADEHRERVLTSARRMMDIHDETFRKLAR
jgi:hypothetical protein